MAVRQRDRLLLKAERLLGSRRYDEAIRLLEPEVVRYRDSFVYCRLLALACLYSGDFGGAHTYYRRSREIKMRSVDVLLGMAVLHLRRGETSRAVSGWLEVLELEPGNRLASRSLKRVRKLLERDELENWIERGACQELYPPLPPRAILSLPAILSLLLILALLSGALAIIPLLLQNADHEDALRTGLAESALENSDRKDLIDNNGSFSQVLTESEILKLFEEARTLFRGYRDERAKVALNRILDSNASDAIKNKAAILKGYTADPGFDSIKDRIPYAEAAQQPLLYRDCWVIWRGLAANIVERESTTQFDLLVDYDGKSTLRGIVSVSLPFAARIEAQIPLEILGKISFERPDSLRFYLEGAALHQSRRFADSP